MFVVDVHFDCCLILADLFDVARLLRADVLNCKIEGVTDLFR